MKKILLLLLVLLPSIALAEPPLLDQPHWSLEVKGGLFEPAPKDWSTYYGRKDMSAYGASLAYKVRQWVDLGIGADWTRVKGRAQEVFHGNLAGGTSLQLVPVDVFIIFRGVISEDQIVIPYVGGGWTRVFYRQAVEGQPPARGRADGYHARAGLQFSLDAVDAIASNRMYLDYGVFHTYLFTEAEASHAVVHSVGANLGGTTYRAGLLFEF